MGASDADRDADGHAHGAGGQDQRQTLSRFLPVALVHDEQKTQAHAHANLPVALQ